MLDWNLLDWLEKDQVTYAALFDDMRNLQLQNYDKRAVEK